MSGVLNDCDTLLQGAVVRITANALVAQVQEALDTATAARDDADAAMLLLADIASDGKLTPGEKPDLVAKRDIIIAEQAGIEAQATAMAITTEKTAYTTAITALTTYLASAPLTGWNTIPGGTINITGTDLRTKFNDVYTKRQALLNTITTVAATKATWSSISGTGKPEDGATKGAPAGTLVNGVTVENITTAVTNFNSSNDRNLAALAIPTIVADGTAVDHTIRKDGGADVSFEWAWAGTEGDIDGFLVYVYQSNSTFAYTFGTSPALETVYTVPASKRAFILYGSAADVNITFGVQAYRSVDKDVNATGLIKSPLVKPSLAAENPYRPATSVAFSGDITGTVNGTAVATLLANAVAGKAASDAIAVIADDNVLSRGEKPGVVQQWTVIDSEKAGLIAQASALSVSSTDYAAKWQALNDHLSGLSPLYSDLTQDTPITGTTFRTKFTDYYLAKQALQNATAAAAATKANWALINGRPPDDSIKNNLIDLSFWKRDGALTWTLNGPDYNRLCLSITDVGGGPPGPKGGNEVVWYCAENATGEQGGGWDNAPVTIDPTKTYRFVVPVRRISGSGQAYWGPSANVANINSTVAASNPYFINGVNLPAGKWYLLVGYVYPAGSTGNTHNDAGVWDCSTGAKTTTGFNFNALAGAGAVNCRAYQYYATNGAEQIFGRPMVNVVDGTEPALREYFEGNAVLNSALTASISAAQAAADTANAKVDAVVADSVLDRGEKVDLITEWQTEDLVYAQIVSQANALGANVSSYVTQHELTSQYLLGLSPAWDSITQNTNIDRETHRLRFKSLYQSRAAAQNNISAKAATLANSDNSIRTPIGGKYTTTTQFVNGALKIRLPQAYTNTMMRFTVDIYEYRAGYSCTLEIAGYNHTAGWQNVTARVVGGSNVEYPVFFGQDGARCCVWIGSAGDVWDYPQVQVRDFFAGYSNTAQGLWESGWVISFDTRGAINVSAQVLDTYPAADWRKVVGTGRPENDATKGAPAGTLVAGVDAATIASQAAAAAALTSPPVLGNVGDLNVNYAYLGPAKTVATINNSTSNGKAPFAYTYNFSILESNDTGESAAFTLTKTSSGGNTNNNLTIKALAYVQGIVVKGLLNITVRDASGLSSSQDVNFTFTSY